MVGACLCVQMRVNLLNTLITFITFTLMYVIFSVHEYICTYVMYSHMIYLTPDSIDTMIYVILDSVDTIYDLHNK